MCVCESLCFPKLCPFHFCICVRVHFAVVYWTVAVILSVSGRLRCYQESHSGASNCSFQAQFASQRSPKGPTGCDIMSVGAEFILPPGIQLEREITPGKANFCWGAGFMRLRYGTKKRQHLAVYQKILYQMQRKDH